MISYLNIKNFALIENCEIEFSKGLNIISGETGAGKSILILALSILLGGRASTEQVRTGVDEAVLNATIQLEGQHSLKEKLSEIGISLENDEILIRRILTSSGKSRSFINGNSVTSKELELISSFLFDFHGQHDGVSLLKKQTHIKYLDDYINLSDDLGKLKNIFLELKKTEDDLKIIENADKDKEKRLELLQFEIEEIEVAEIKDSEDDELKKEIKILENMEKITSSLDDIQKNFRGQEGILAKLKSTKNLLSQISEMDGYFNDKANDVSDIYYKLEDIEGEILNKMNQYQYEPNKLDKLIERSEIIEKLKRKYGHSIEKVREYLVKSKKELDLINFSTEKKEKLTSYLNELKKKYLDFALIISNKRKQGKIILENKVKEELQQLGMEKVEFIIQIDIEEVNDNFLLYNSKKIRYREDGIDNIEFLISPNKGEPLKQLTKIASGGELSRIILSLKTVLAQNDTVETMIFDEIDVGIGGKVAISVSKTLKKLSSKKQILCITHLAQIASSGTKNFLIHKDIINGRTVTNLKPLNNEEKINEVARMLSGHITEVSLNHAKELIESINN